MRSSPSRMRAAAFGRVALGGDALVPVVVRIGRVLDLDRLEPGVLARRLVEVPVDADEAVHSDVRLDEDRLPESAAAASSAVSRAAPAPASETPRAAAASARASGRPWTGPRIATAPRLPTPLPPYSGGVAVGELPPETGRGHADPVAVARHRREVERRRHDGPLRPSPVAQRGRRRCARRRGSRSTRIRPGFEVELVQGRLLAVEPVQVADPALHPDVRGVAPGGASRARRRGSTRATGRTRRP